MTAKKATNVTTKQLAKQLKTSPRRVRVILRSMKKFQKDGYTRYKLSPAVQRQVRDIVKKAA